MCTFATVFKKVIILFVAMLYLSVVSGLAVNFHYCMGSIASISFEHSTDHSDGSCSKCGMEKAENHCCKDEIKILKLNDSHQASSFSFANTGLFEIIPVTTIDLIDAVQGRTPAPEQSYFSPPPKESNKVYRSVRVFLI
jgi:hypothetical protein